MPFSNTPTYSTYRTEKIPFDGNDLFRSGDLSIARDLQIVNFYYESLKQENKNKERFLVKRPGIASTAYSLTKDAASDVIRGSFYDPDNNAFYWAVNDNVYKLKPNVSSTPSTLATLNTSSGYVGFCSFLNGSNVRYTCWSDGTDLWTENINTATTARVTDADCPTPHLPYPVYLDGYLFLAKTTTADIYNSNVDDPTAWTAGDFISMEMGASYAKRIARIKNYLVAFSSNTIEYFWDSAQVSGSPMSRYESPFRNVGYVTGFCQIGESIFFVGQDEKKNLSVYELNSFKLNSVSNPVVDRTIQVWNNTSNALSDANLNQDGLSISCSGHDFYVLRTSETTWVYDLEEKTWYEWKGSAGTGLALEAAWSMFNGQQYVALASQTTMSLMSPSVYQDLSSNFTCTYVTEKASFDSLNRKVCNRLSVSSDQYTSSGTSNLSLSWSDDDYTSYNTAQNINVFGKRKLLYRLGQFIERAFKLTYADNYPLRLRGLELELNVGAN